MSRGLIALAFGLLACEQPSDAIEHCPYGTDAIELSYSLQIEPECEPYRADILHAAARWNDIALGEPVIHEGGEHRLRIICDPGHRVCERGWIAGANGGHIALCPERMDELGVVIATVVTHELGHALLGPEHVDGGIMEGGFPAWMWYAPAIDCATVDRPTAAPAGV